MTVARIMRIMKTRLHRHSAAWLPLWLGCIYSSVVAGAAPQGAALASAHRLATEAGAEALRSGGNAFDAAIAVTASLAVVEPYASGIGGGGFYLLHLARRQYEVCIDAREVAPLRAHRDLYLGQYLGKTGAVRDRLSIDGAPAAAIPGVPAALVHLAAHYGRLPLRRSLQPAIRLAQGGFRVTPRYRAMAKLRLAALRRSPAAAAIFLERGRVPTLGAVIRQPDLARTLRTLAEHGAAGFYRGRMAARLVAGVRSAGGIWTRQDLAGYRVIERRPLVGHYLGMRVVSAPPPSSGGTVLLQVLNILEGYRLPALAPLTRKHLLIEAMRRAYRDRAFYLGDPDFVSMPLPRLLSETYAAQLRASISLSRAGLSTGRAAAPEPEAANTSHFSIVDAEGNRVAATLSINYPFGSGLVVPDTGVLLNDEMDDFSVSPGRPNAYGLVGGDANAIAPRKRPLSSMTPTFLETDTRVAVLGTPGGSRIISMVLLAALDFAAGHGVHSWVSLPRFHHQYLPDEVQHEPRAFTPAERATLRAYGHRLRGLAEGYGNMQVVLLDKTTGRVEAARDPRGEGWSRVLPAPRRERVPFTERAAR